MRKLRPRDVISLPTRQASFEPRSLWHMLFLQHLWADLWELVLWTSSPRGTVAAIAVACQAPNVLCGSSNTMSSNFKMRQIWSTTYKIGTSLVVQWLRLHASTAGGMDLIPGWRVKIPHATGQLSLHATTTEHTLSPQSHYFPLRFISMVHACYGLNCVHPKEVGV